MIVVFWINNRLGDQVRTFQIGVYRNQCVPEIKYRFTECIAFSFSPFSFKCNNRPRHILNCRIKWIKDTSYSIWYPILYLRAFLYVTRASLRHLMNPSVQQKGEQEIRGGSVNKQVSSTPKRRFPSPNTVAVMLSCIFPRSSHSERAFGERCSRNKISWNTCFGK